MNIGNILLWGFAATMVLTIMTAVSKPLGLTRMDIPFLLGTFFTANRNRAPWYGFIGHVLLGWGFSFLYAAAFESAGLHTWWFGGAIGLVHGVFVLSVGLQLLGFIHPRMALLYQGPTPTRQLEPPGFFALNYGPGTPVVTLLAHVVYGVILAVFYR